MTTNGHNEPNGEPHSEPATWILAKPTPKYLERFNSYPPRHPVREAVNNLEVELVIDPYRLSWGLEDDDPRTSPHCIIESDRQYSPLVRICFEVVNDRITPLDFREVA